MKDFLWRFRHDLKSWGKKENALCRRRAIKIPFFVSKNLPWFFFLRKRREKLIFWHIKTPALPSSSCIHAYMIRTRELHSNFLSFLVWQIAYLQSPPPTLLLSLEFQKNLKLEASESPTFCEGGRGKVTNSLLPLLSGGLLPSYSNYAPAAAAYA